MCMRSSSAFAAHIQPWTCRYSSRLPAGVSVTCALTGQGHCYLHHLFGAHPHPLQVVVVGALELGEVLALGALLAHSLDLLHDARHELWLGTDAPLAQRVLDDQGARMLAVDVTDLAAEVFRWDELVDRRVDEHARGVDSRLVAEDVEPDSGLGRLHEDAADPLQVPRQLPKLLVAKAGDLDLEQVAQLQQNLVHGRVT